MLTRCKQGMGALLCQSIQQVYGLAVQPTTHLASKHHDLTMRCTRHVTTPNAVTTPALDA